MALSYIDPIIAGTTDAAVGTGTSVDDPVVPPNPTVPFWAWNRLESRPRNQDFNSILKAAIHDPLWMLGRQWQMGEFTGTDSGSGVLARVQIDYQKIDGIGKYGDSAPVVYNQDMPLEPIVEAVSYNWSIKERILMGKKWLYYVKQAAPSIYSSLLAWFKSSAYASPPFYPYGIVLGVKEPTISSTQSDTIAGADIFCERDLNNFISSSKLSDHLIDGVVVYQAIKSGVTLTTIIGPSGISGFTESTDLVTAKTNFETWVEKMYTVPILSKENWAPSNLEYQFDTYWPNDAATNQLRLPVRGYHGGHLDWHAFTQDNPSSPPGLTHTAPSTYARQMIVSQSNFPGMPSSRWWQFEDGRVNFCNLDADPTDLSKVILTQFALIYQDDWFLVPCTLPVGSYATTKGIVVTDVFGINTLVVNHNVDSVTPATGTGAITAFGESNDWNSWRWMDISMKSGVANTVKPAGKLIIPPVANGTLESKPIESVLFARDEMSDIVWGIEQIVPNNLGKGKDGHDTVKKYVEYLKKMRNSADINASVPIDPDAKLTYKLESNSVPENWIPLTPVRASPPNGRNIQYQRATMPRIIDEYDTSLIRPRTEILNYGFRDIVVPSPPSSVIRDRRLYPQSYGFPAYSTYKPLYIYEEEIPKAGVIVQTTFKRTRWYNGKIVNWVGRRKITGRGEGHSGLVYDTVTPVDNP